MLAEVGEARDPISPQLDGVDRLNQTVVELLDHGRHRQILFLARNTVLKTKLRVINDHKVKANGNQKGHFYSALYILLLISKAFQYRKY